MAGKLAIVLSGGGAKGAFQVGVLDALINKHGVNPAIVVGTSTGAIQALGVAQQDVAGLVDVWMGLKGKHPEEEMAALSPTDVQVFHVEQLAVPGLDAERCIIWMRKPAQPA